MVSKDLLQELSFKYNCVFQSPVDTKWLGDLENLKHFMAELFYAPPRMSGARPGEVLKYLFMIKSSLHGMRTTTL
jgi:hypothetical protein